MKPAAVWKKPDGLSSEKWQEALDSTWDSLWDADDIFLQLKNLINVNSPDICTLQQTWDTYMLALNKVYRTAIVGIHAQADGEMERKTRTMLRQSGQNQKGAVAKHQFVTSATRLAGNRPQVNPCTSCVGTWPDFMRWYVRFNVTGTLIPLS